MTESRRFQPGSRTRGRAFSMVETIVSIMIVGGLLVAAMNTAGAAARGQQKIGDRGKGMLLAESLMDEILQLEYEDPTAASGSFGLEASEAGGGTRSLWDDVDDYNTWKSSPPQTKDGTILIGYGGWERSVVVEWVNSMNLTGVSGTDTGVKRITVSVTRDGVPVAKLVAVRAGAPPSRVLDPRKLYMSIT